MKTFEHVSVLHVDQVAELVRADAKNTRLIAGGTDLLPRMRLGLERPRRLVNLKMLHRLKNIEFAADGTLHIGALTTLRQVGEHPVVEIKYPFLARAARSIGTPQVRHQATVAGNLCQRPQCWYFRGPYDCLKKGGEACFAQEGANQHHAIFAADPCCMVHPSDLAPVLVALGARVRVRGAREYAETPLEEFFLLPQKGYEPETRLLRGDVITEIIVPSHPASLAGRFLKVSERRGGSFALASATVLVRKQGGVVAEIHIVLGGVAPVPWRARQAEAHLLNTNPDAPRLREAAERATAGAQPRTHNAFKVSLVRTLVEDALTALLLPPPFITDSYSLD